MTTPEEGQPRTARGWAPYLVGAVLVVATLGLLSHAGTQLGAQQAFLPAWLALVLFCDALTAALLVEQYLAGRGARMLVLSWAYVWSAVLVVPTVLALPGVVSPTGLFGDDPNVSAWFWTARHLGLPLVIALALVPWPAGWERRLALDRPGSALRRVAGTHLVVMVALALTFAAAILAPGRLPHVMRPDGSLAPGFTGAVLVVNLLALAACLGGVRRRRPGRSLESWALVAVVAGVCDVALVMSAQSHWSLAWYGARMLGLAGAVLVLLTMLREVSRLHRRESSYTRRLETQNAALRSAQGLRDHLIAVVSHDLRTPIAGLQGYLELLKDDTGLSPELIERMHERSWMLTRRLGLLTEDLLAVATIDHGDLQMIPEPVDLARQLADCASGFPDLDLVVECAPGLSASADPLRLQQVLANLVRNAQKHGAEPVRIAARPAPGQDAGASTRAVTIAVSDAGRGVPAEFVPRLFERYSRADDRATAGSGLGLSVVRDLVEAHGGTVSYAPDHNEFLVTLPAGDPAAGSEHPRATMGEAEVPAPADPASRQPKTGFSLARNALTPSVKSGPV